MNSPIDGIETGPGGKLGYRVQMPHIVKSELRDILAIAQRVIDHCLANASSITTTTDFATAPLIASRRVTLHGGSGRIEDASGYSADSSIKLTVPSFGWANLEMLGRRPSNEIVALITSMIAHELVHERQEIIDPANYQHVVDHQTPFDRTVEHEPREWFDGYYSSALEREAHAAQAAVALWCLAELQSVPLDPNEDPLTTEALKRPLKRMRFKGQAGESDIDDWWDEVLRLAKVDVIAFG